ncbi:ThuA domain-containing protein [Planctomycetaceae bacterium SH139]
MRPPALFALLVLFVGPLLSSPASSEDLKLRLRYQTETEPGSRRYHRLERAEGWRPQQTAVIVCDMWDSHHCFRAVQRVNELAPRMNELLHKARAAGATIIHAPSECMEAYADHPARSRALQVPAAASYPDNIGDWCYSIDAEDPEKYPIDQSDGGEDDTPSEHARWEAELRKQGRNPQAPWQRQIAALEIDEQLDFITDRGHEVWNILQARGIENVVLVGVHTNMCVLGRPFGLRRLSQAGKHVVLCRDLTDTMYNPAAWPYVSHFSGTDLIIDHIERYVCPTISSDQLLGGKPFRFSADQRPRVMVISSEVEYETERTLPLFVREHLRADHQVSMVFGDATKPDSLPGIELLAEADIALLSIRRRTPPPEQLQVVRDFIAAGKPVVGIRTANHAFSLRGKPAPAGAADWPEFDAQVFGGSYTNHYGNQLATTVHPVEAKLNSPLLRDISPQPFLAGGSLYIVSPLAADCQVLMLGRVAGQQPEPVAWTFQRPAGGASFYTSLGAPADFDHPVFVQLLRNAIRWAAEQR